MRIKMFTHIDLDGVGCAILLQNAYRNAKIDIEYCEYNNINEKVEEFLNENNYTDYDKIFITDISVNEKIAEKIDYIHNIREFVLLDHHKTADWLNKYRWATVEENSEYLERKTSGTQMLHEWMISHNSEYIKNNWYNSKEFIRLVNDYDTWHWNTIGDLLPKKFNDLLYIYGRDKFIEKVLFELRSCLTHFHSTDELILELKQQEIDNFIESKNKTLKIVEIDDVNLGIVFAESNISELGNKLCKLNPNIDAIAIININHSISYRTIKDDIDVSAIAKKYGGGGHSKSSGSPISDTIRNNLIVDLLKY